MFRVAEDGNLLHPYVFSILNGNPTIIYWKSVYWMQELDLDIFNVMIAKVEDEEDDILCIGGHVNNNQPFSAWNRRKEKDYTNDTTYILKYFV